MTSKEVLEKLRKSKLLTIQDHDRIHGGDWSGMYGPPTNYQKSYPSRLKESLGIDRIVVRSKELIGEIEKVSEKEAEEIADMWISEAKEVIEVIREDVIRTAELYIAYKELLEKYDADGITVSSWAFVPDMEINAMPPLAEMELAKELIPCCCENDMCALVTQTIGTYISARPGFVGDQVSSWVGLRREDAVKSLPENYVAIGHCYGPINPHGNDRVPYVIRSHVVQGAKNLSSYIPRGNDRVRLKYNSRSHIVTSYDIARMTSEERRDSQYKPINLVGIRVEWPVDEVVTIVKFDPYNKKAQVFTGRTFDPHPFFKDFDNTVCRTKMAIKTDVQFGHSINDCQVKNENNSRIAVLKEFRIGEFHRLELRITGTLEDF